MDIKDEDVIGWILATRSAQGLMGTVSEDPGLHSRTLAAIDRAQEARAAAHQSTSESAAKAHLEPSPKEG